MKQLPLVLACVLNAGCGKLPCSGQPAVCIDLTVESGLGNVDQLLFTADMPQSESVGFPDQPASSPLTFPWRLALDFPASITQVEVSARALSGVGVVGYGQVVVTVPPSGYSSAFLVVQDLASIDGGIDFAQPDAGQADGAVDLAPNDGAADMTLCPDASCKLSLLIVHTSLFSQYWLDVQSKLMATGSFSVVDTFDARSATPTLAQLQMYGSVLMYSQEAFADAVTLGNNLADYWDSGGRVVVAPLADANNPASGRFFDPNNHYLLIGPNSTLLQGADSLGTIVEPTSPLVAGVATLSAQQAYRSSGGAINGGIVVAKWQTGEPLIVRGTVNGRTRVDINLQPPSSDGAGQDGWTGNGAAIMRNALVY